MGAAAWVAGQLCKIAGLTPRVTPRGVVGDPVVLGLLEWWARGGSGEVEFPDVDAVAEGREVLRWEALPGDAVAVADGRWPGFAELVRERVLTAEELTRAYPDPERPGFLRPFHRQMLREKWAARPEAGRPLIVYHHVPKCAGMSMFHHLNAHLRWNDALVHLDARARADVLGAGCVPFEWKDPRELARIEVLFGHEVSGASLERVAGRDFRLVTCLRDPVDRMVSHYNWEMHQRDLAGQRVPEFGEWYGKQERNWMTRWLGRGWLGLNVGRMAEADVAARVREALAGFWVVGTTENFAESMRPVTELLGLPAVARATNAAGESYPRRFVADGAWRERIAEENELDRAMIEEVGK